MRLSSARPSPSAISCTASRAPAGRRGLRLARAKLFLGPLGQPFQIGQRQPAEYQHLRAAQQCGVQFEGRVFGGGADQKDGPVFHMGQEPILLGLVEAVDLVHEQQRSLAVAAPNLGRLEHLAQFRNAGENGADLDEMQGAFIGKQAGDGGLADPGRPPQDQAGQAAGGQHHAQRRLGAKHLVLSDHLGQRPRAQPVGQRPGGAGPGRVGAVEQVAHSLSLRAIR
jgi:hypothetical protein